MSVVSSIEADERSKRLLRLMEGIRHQSGLGLQYQHTVINIRIYRAHTNSHQLKQ